MLTSPFRGPDFPVPQVRKRKHGAQPILLSPGQPAGFCSTIFPAVSYPFASPVAKRRTKFSIIFTSTVRIFFTTLLFTAGGMGAGLFLGIVGTVIYGMISGSHIDMTNAYRHVAIPLAILTGSIALIGSAVLEVHARRTRTSR